MISKRKLTYFLIALYFFLSGVEYAVILPTMWLYIHDKFGATPAFLGLMLSAFSISDLFTSPIYGRVSDNRFVAGLGAGAGASIVSEIARTTSQRERTGVLAIIMSCRQVGLVIGPGCNLFLRLIDTSIGPYPLNAYSVPGLFMASLWLLHTLLCACLYTDFHRLPPPAQTPFPDETRPLLADQRSPPVASESGATMATVAMTRSYFVNEFLRHEIVAILATIFATFFNQTALEAMLTPLTKDFLDWGELGNSLIYLGAGVEVILVFMVVRWASRRCFDSSLILLGSGLSVAAIAAMLAYFPYARPGDPLNLPLLIGAVVLDVVALPFLVTCSVSLYSKITSEATQGFSQGLRRSVIGLATILGPLWAGSMLDRLSFMLGVLLGLILIMTFLFCLSTRQLRSREKAGQEQESPPPPSVITNTPTEA